MSEGQIEPARVDPARVDPARVDPARVDPARVDPALRRDAEMPQRSDAFAHLSLEGLRSYRRTLSIEENRVSYWRRIVQARLDVVRAVTDGPVPTVASLRDVFAERRPTTNRTAMMGVWPIDDMPPLPDLMEVWSREPKPGDRAENAAIAHDLSKAESQLSAYRMALHRRLTGATGELIARYREQPSLCLSALPLHRPLAKVRIG